MVAGQLAKSEVIWPMSRVTQLSLITSADDCLSATPGFPAIRQQHVFDADDVETHENLCESVS